MSPTVKAAAEYLRMSTEHQQYSIENQSTAIRQYADSGVAKFKAILVYDVSRWGRFQDADESAHYEFVCKRAGIPVHYCAETFANDGSLSSSIMKGLKRVMAGEYSRELSARVVRAKKVGTERGFRVGGRAGYGLRRMLVSEDRKPNKSTRRRRIRKKRQGNLGTRSCEGNRNRPRNLPQNDFREAGSGGHS